MNAWAIGLIVFVCVFGGALLGMYLRCKLPPQHSAFDGSRLPAARRSLECEAGATARVALDDLVVDDAARDPQRLPVEE